jgi:hypothetical protein
MDTLQYLAGQIPALSRPGDALFAGGILLTCLQHMLNIHPTRSGCGLLVPM